MHAILVVELLLAAMYCTARTAFLVIEASLRRPFVGQARSTAISSPRQRRNRYPTSSPSHASNHSARFGGFSNGSTPNQTSIGVAPCRF